MPVGVNTFYYSAFQDVKGKLTVKLPPTVEYVLGPMGKKYRKKTNRFTKGVNIMKVYKNITFVVEEGSKSHETMKSLGFNYKFY